MVYLITSSIDSSMVLADDEVNAARTQLDPLVPGSWKSWVLIYKKCDRSKLTPLVENKSWRTKEPFIESLSGSDILELV